MAVRAQYTTTLLMLLPSCASRCDDDGFAQPRWQVSSAWPHHRDVASAVEGIVGAALCHIDEVRDQIAANLFRIDEVRHAEALAPLLLGVVDVGAGEAVPG
jgi:hypothetical protein